jgi:hypothetical protein
MITPSNEEGVWYKATAKCSLPHPTTAESGFDLPPARAREGLRVQLKYGS